MPTFLHVIAARIRAVFQSSDLEADFDQELETHLRMATEEKIRRGLPVEEARRTARVELGGLTQLREASRAARSFPWLGGFWLDVKLGLRMLRKSWGLTLVGGLAMTIVIGVGAGVFAFVDLTFWGKLPLDEGDRVVAIQTWDAAGHRRRDSSLADFERWRDTLGSVVDVGGFQTVERSLVAADGPAEPVSIAEMTASGFRLARVPPLLGRPLLEEDERDDANPVVVIGYDVWQSRFSADPTVVGQTVRLGETVHTVVGVMPEDFAFPLNYRLWTPLRVSGSGDLRNGGPSGVVFARLAPGVTLEGAQAEVTTLGLLPRAAVAETGEELHPRVVSYTFAFTGDFEGGEVGWMIRLILLLVTLLLIPPCANIAILVYARTVARQDEFAARYALGASRGRIIGQLFIEVLVLATAAACVALVLVREALQGVQNFLGPELRDGAPFWWDFSLSFTTILFAAGLAVVAALVAGVVPALKATGHRMQMGLSALGGRASMRLGATWTVLIVAQVAFSVAALPVAVEMAYGTVRSGILGPGFAAEEYLTARVMVDGETPSGVEDDAGDRPAPVRLSLRIPPDRAGATARSRARGPGRDRGGGGAQRGDVEVRRSRRRLNAGRLRLHGQPPDSISSGGRRLLRGVRPPAPDRPRVRRRRLRARASRGGRQPELCGDPAGRREPAGPTGPLLQQPEPGGSGGFGGALVRDRRGRGRPLRRHTQGHDVSSRGAR